MSPEQLRIGLIAAPLTAPATDRTIETSAVIRTLARGLADRGHQVVVVNDDREADEALHHCDVIHDHAQARPDLDPGRSTAPLIATSHGPPGPGLAKHFERCRNRATMIAISQEQAAAAPPGVVVETVIHYGLDLNRYHFDPAGGGYLLAIGSMRPASGFDSAIDSARRSDTPLLISGRMRTPIERQYFDTTLRPRLGRGIEYVGDLDRDTRIELLAGARALLCPAATPDTAGLLPLEALACGTPVLCRPVGAVAEIVDHGTTGFLAPTMGDLVRSIRRCDHLDRRACRSAAEQHFSMDRMARDHEQVYQRVVTTHSPWRPITAAAQRRCG